MLIQHTRVVDEATLSEFRAKAMTSNISSDFAKEFLRLFICPVCKTQLEVSEEHLICENGHRVPIINGSPDFFVFSENVTEEKISQSSFHDDEENNEKFSEIVFRPYAENNKTHISSWLYHLNHFKKVLPAKLSIELENTTILNCGCGGGFEAEFFAQNGALMVGFDISQLRVEASATRFKLNDLPGLFYRGEAVTLPFRDNSFDLVLYHDSLHHVPIEEIPIAIREAARVAKKGVVLLEANDSPFRLLLELIGLSISVEASGNYAFKFKKNLMEFWASKYSLELVNYSVLFTKKEHCPKIYAIPVFGWLAYKLVRIAGLFLKPIGNEACIILKKP